MTRAAGARSGRCGPAAPGSFRTSYSFKHVLSSRSYRFRARARYEPSYPFLLGTSRTVRVRVG